MSPVPFAGAAALAWLAVLVGSTVDWPGYIAATVVLVVSGVLARAERTRGWPASWGLLPASLSFLLAVALLRSAAGGISSGAGILSMIPVFYAALCGAERRQLYVVLVAVGLFYLAPIFLIGPPPYPHSQYRAALLSVSVSSIVGLATRSLVARVREQATEARRREQMLEQVGQIVSGLFDSADPRRDLCEAPRAIAGATVAMLLEPTESGAMRATAAAGVEVWSVELPAHEPDPVHDAFHSGRPRIIDAGTERTRPQRALWEAVGRPEVLLVQPLRRGNETSGVLVVGWPADVAVSGSRATVVALLAHEAALAITRADELTRLTDMAQSDPLTGLPNRRAWDARLAQAVQDGQSFAVAILDLDRFKQFNDTYGHPAGDRLLKETAAAWRDQLRTGDLLARLGGEEFGLLLFDCDLACAEEVIGRLRALVTSRQTCSVGLALRRPEDSLDAVVARADRALYAAKDGGRDRACAAA